MYLFSLFDPENFTLNMKYQMMETQWYYVMFNILWLILLLKNTVKERAIIFIMQFAHAKACSESWRYYFEKRDDHRNFNFEMFSNSH